MENNMEGRLSEPYCDTWTGRQTATHYVCGTTGSWTRIRGGERLVPSVSLFIAVQPGFDPESIKTKSVAASALCAWVLNIIKYHHIRCEVRPKEEKLAEAQEKLAQSKASLKKVQDQVCAVAQNWLCSCPWELGLVSTGHKLPLFEKAPQASSMAQERPMAVNALMAWGLRDMITPLPRFFQLRKAHKTAISHQHP